MANIFKWFVDNFFWIQIGSTILSIILLVAIVRLIIKVDYYADKREYGWEILKLGNLRQKKLTNLWQRTLKKVAKPNPEEWKRAVFEVDNFFDDSLKGSGYIGGSEEERMAKVGKDKISNIQELIAIHLEITALKAEENSVIEHEKVKEFLRAYRKAFRELGLLE